MCSMLYSLIPRLHSPAFIAQYKKAALLRYNTSLVAEALFQLDDPEIIYDLRKLNGNPNSSSFDTFWDELGAYLEELTPAVDDRRHTETPHMPVAISLRHLRQLIKSEDESKLKIPSLEWLQLQFWSQNPYSTSALRHTGRLNFKFGVQVHLLRHIHVDARYMSMILRYLKEFCVQLHSLVNYVYISVDDKAIIPVGEPGLPVSSGVRGHNRSIVLAEGPSPGALDHDFHVSGVVPSVSFVVDIPKTRFTKERHLCALRTRSLSLRQPCIMVLNYQNFSGHTLVKMVWLQRSLF